MFWLLTFIRSSFTSLKFGEPHGAISKVFGSSVNHRDTVKTWNHIRSSQVRLAKINLTTTPTILPGENAADLIVSVEVKVHNTTIRNNHAKC